MKGELWCLGTDCALPHCSCSAELRALQGGVVSAVFDVSFWGKQNCINYRFCSRCLGQILILFLNVSIGMVVLEGVFIMGIHSGCVFWYFKAELVELWVADYVLHWFGVSLRRNAGFWCSGSCVEHRTLSPWFIAVSEEVQIVFSSSNLACLYSVWEHLWDVWAFTYLLYIVSTNKINYSV